MADDEENLYVQIHVSQAKDVDDQTKRLNFALARVRANARSAAEAETVAAIVVRLRATANELRRRGPPKQQAANWLDREAMAFERGDWRPKPDGRRG